MTRSGPLAGVRIVEFEAIGPVPLAGMMLADMGADIVRLARPSPGGDPGASVLYRGRTLAPANLKDAADRDAALDLVAGADILIEGYRPGVLERLGLGPDVCLARNPQLVFGRMTGWGQDGPLSPYAGHDINYIAVTGALHAIGQADAPPTVPLNLVGDYGGGALFLVTGVLAALLAARSSGRGQVVDAAMTEGTATLLSMFHGFQAEGRWQDRREANLLDGAAPFYRCYECADGRHVAVGCLEPQFFHACVTGLGLDPATLRQYDTATWPSLRKAFAAAFMTRTRDEWAEHFAATDACVSPVLSLTEAPAHPHNQARGSFIMRNAISQAAPAPRFSATPSAVADPSVASMADVAARWSLA